MQVLHGHETTPGAGQGRMDTDPVSTVYVRMTRTPQEGGIMNGGPFNGRIMAYDKPVMPIYNPAGKRIGACFWQDDHWEYEKDDPDREELYP